MHRSNSDAFRERVNLYMQDNVLGKHVFRLSADEYERMHAGSSNIPFLKIIGFRYEFFWVGIFDIHVASFLVNFPKAQPFL